MAVLNHLKQGVGFCIVTREETALVDRGRVVSRSMARNGQGTQVPSKAALTGSR